MLFVALWGTPLARASGANFSSVGRNNVRFRSPLGAVVMGYATQVLRPAPNYHLLQNIQSKVKLTQSHQECAPCWSLKLD
jgi:hypothetical protein